MTSPAALAAARAVRPDRLAARLAAMAEIGRAPIGGVCRLALSAEDARARALLCDWAAARGWATFTDAIGNLFVRRPGTEDSLPPVLIGSHLDSQPTGGNYDGVYGVLAAFEALEALEEAGIRTRHPLECVAWTNEEGARFQPGCMGSAAFAGAIPLATLLASRDKAGTAVADALPAVHALAPAMPERPLGFPVAGYIEIHIEQGPRLEAEGRTIGVVTGIQGARWFTVEVFGEEAHAGTTPVANRKDALQAALDMIHALRELMHDPDDVVRCTVGRMEVFPGAPNTVPGRVLFTIDFRHPDAETVRRLGDAVEPTLRAQLGPCTMTLAETFKTAPVDFHPAVVGLIDSAAEALGLPRLSLPSGANHDAKFLAEVCPSGMIFIPCLRGISHNPAEYASPEDCTAGARVLAAAAADLALPA
ncbi:MAG TPA: M20 family metallo-hydrolase [Alphaproteobacteria bacterium]|nr:M20 family metallo-hydrolase [Alphaproteobacteria bacterium]